MASLNGRCFVLSQPYHEKISNRKTLENYPVIVWLIKQIILKLLTFTYVHSIYAIAVPATDLK